MKVGAQWVITREVEALERNARPRTCFDAAVQDLASRFPGEKAPCHYGGYRTKLQILDIYDAFQHTIYSDKSYKTLLPLPEWKSGQLKPPKEVAKEG